MIGWNGAALELRPRHYDTEVRLHACLVALRLAVATIGVQPIGREGV